MGPILIRVTCTQERQAIVKKCYLKECLTFSDKYIYTFIVGSMHGIQGIQEPLETYICMFVGEELVSFWVVFKGLLNPNRGQESWL